MYTFTVSEGGFKIFKDDVLLILQPFNPITGQAYKEDEINEVVSHKIEELELYDKISSSKGAV